MPATVVYVRATDQCVGRQWGRQPCSRITVCCIEPGLAEKDRAAEVGASYVGGSDVGTGDVGHGRVGAAQISPDEVASLEVIGR